MNLKGAFEKRKELNKFKKILSGLSDKKRAYLSELINMFPDLSTSEIEFLAKNIILPSDEGYKITKDDIPKTFNIRTLNFALMIMNFNASKCSISPQLVDNLRKLFDDHSIIGIHLPGVSGNIYQQGIFTNGLENNADLLRGGAPNYEDGEGPNVEKTVTLCDNLAFLLCLLESGMYGYYKTSKETINEQRLRHNNYKNGAYLFKFNEEDVKNSDGIPQPIYYDKDGTPTILPKYVIGFISFDDNDMIIEKNNIAKKDIKATMYNQNAYFRLKRKNSISK